MELKDLPDYYVKTDSRTTIRDLKEIVRDLLGVNIEAVQLLVVKIDNTGMIVKTLGDALSLGKHAMRFWDGINELIIYYRAWNR